MNESSYRSGWYITSYYIYIHIKTSYTILTLSIYTTDINDAVELMVLNQICGFCYFKSSDFAGNYCSRCFDLYNIAKWNFSFSCPPPSASAYEMGKRTHTGNMVYEIKYIYEITDTKIFYENIDEFWCWWWSFDG